MRARGRDGSRQAQVRRRSRPSRSSDQAERELNLHEWRVGGVALWRLLRMPTYYATVKRLGLFGAPHGTSRWSGRVVARISRGYARRSA